jgi:hypothetical protein
MSIQNKKYIFKIDTTDRKNRHVELFLDQEIVDYLIGEIDVIQSIKSILNRNNLDLDKDVYEVIPNTGPGSFTGIKTGIVIANTINWYLKNGKKYKPNYGMEPNIN